MKSERINPPELDFNLFEILACPQCHGVLHRTTNGLACVDCARRYPILDGVPVFVEGAHTPEFAPQYESTDALIRQQLGGTIHQVLWKLYRNPLKVTDESREIITDRLLTLLSSEAMILNLGSGQFAQNQPLFRKYQSRIVNLDIVPFEGTHVTGDGHQLPFFSETFDLVYMSCVLEHVRDASIVVEECYRVLASGGYLYSTTPFVSRFHSDSDYRRWTLMGLEYLFRDFEVVASGIHCGPGSAIALALREFLPLFFGSGYMHLAVKFLSGWLLTPIAYLDPLLVRNPRAYKLAQSFYFLGRKATQA